MNVKGPPQYILGLKKTSLAVSFLLKPITLFGLKEKLSHHFRVFSQKKSNIIWFLCNRYILLQVVVLHPLNFIPLLMVMITS